MPKSQDIIDFWFKESSSKLWFKKNTKFDATIKQRYGKVVIDALSGRLDRWADDADSCLALILLLDQFTRNIFRQSARAFSGDEMALALSLRCVDRGHLNIEKASYCQFMLMPMMHCEDSGIQTAALSLFEQYTSELVYVSAVEHRDIIAQFGRFPHRNEILGRPNTPEEKIFLTQSRFAF